MRDWIPELPDLQRLMMPGDTVGQNNRFGLRSALMRKFHLKDA